MCFAYERNATQRETQIPNKSNTERHKVMGIDVSSNRNPTENRWRKPLCKEQQKKQHKKQHKEMEILMCTRKPTENRCQTDNVHAVQIAAQLIETEATHMQTPESPPRPGDAQSHTIYDHAACMYVYMKTLDDRPITQNQMICNACEQLAFCPTRTTLLHAATTLSLDHSDSIH